MNKFENSIKGYERKATEKLDNGLGYVSELVKDGKNFIQVFNEDENLCTYIALSIGLIDSQTKERIDSYKEERMQLELVKHLLTLEPKDCGIDEDIYLAFENNEEEIECSVGDGLRLGFYGIRGEVIFEKSEVEEAPPVLEELIEARISISFRGNVIKPTPIIKEIIKNKFNIEYELL